jgi:hypothetical protein
MSTRTRFGATLTAAACTALALSAAPAAADPGAHDRDSARGAVADLRQALKPYRTVEAAEDAGYVNGVHCISSSAGGMGIHYVNPALLGAPLDPTRPPILLYGEDGELLGAEFLVPDDDQDLGTDGDRPSLFGQPFDGPMPGHEEGAPVHYDLHVWTHEANPDGVFAIWNPKVECEH